MSRAHVWLIVAAAAAVVIAAWVSAQTWAQTILAPVSNAIGATWAQALLVGLILVVAVLILAKVGVHAA